MKQTKLVNNRYSNKSILLISTTVILVVVVVLVVYVAKHSKTKVILGDTVITVGVADTPEAQMRGLGSQEKLKLNQGMLFVFSDGKPHGFWMKDMRFPIDIIWFDANNRIVYVKEGAEPASYPEIFTPTVSTPLVLEVPAGFFAYHQLKLGDTLKIDR